MANLELLREAYAIIDGVPAHRMDLSFVSYNSSGDPTSIHHCGTIGCAIGLLAMHPRFQALGMYLYTPPHDDPEWGHSATLKGARGYEEVAVEIFDVDMEDAYRLFRPSQEHERQQYDNDKAVWLARVRGYLAEQGT